MARGDSTQKKLLKAAINLFHEFGYKGTSVRDIVSAAKVPKGSFYNYFKSKEALAIAVSDIFYAYALGFLELENTSSPVGRLHKKRVTELLDEAAGRIALVVSQAQEAREIDPGVPTMDLSRFILNSLYGAIFRSKTDRTERPMKLLQRFALEPFLMKKR